MIPKFSLFKCNSILFYNIDNYYISFIGSMAYNRVSSLLVFIFKLYDRSELLLCKRNAWGKLVLNFINTKILCDHIPIVQSAHLIM